jgi:hypothetical protein
MRLVRLIKKPTRDSHNWLTLEQPQVSTVYAVRHFVANLFTLEKQRAGKSEISFSLSKRFSARPTPCIAA